MSNKPRQFSEQYASIFQDASVVLAYQHRPMYPEETFECLLRLIPQGISPRRVLDAGCGTGYIARPLAPSVEGVDAVDISERMIAEARRQPGGDHPHIHWIAAPIESAPLSGPYALIVAAASIHWMDWERVLPRIASLLAPRAVLALVAEIRDSNPWDAALGPVITRYSMNRDYAPYSTEMLVETFEQRGLFKLQGRFQTAAQPFQQSIEAYTASYHARNGLSLDRMEPQAAAQFDRELREVVEPFSQNGQVEQMISARILWGRPLDGQSTQTGSAMEEEG